MIQWKNSYATGVEELDGQHKNLFRYCNDLEDGIKSGHISPQVLELALKFLKKYAEGHFAQEETCMFKYACPLAENNRIAHYAFIKTYERFQKKIINVHNSESALRELHQFLEDWLVDHIGKIDNKLKSCVP